LNSFASTRDRFSAFECSGGQSGVDRHRCHSVLGDQEQLDSAIEIFLIRRVSRAFNRALEHLPQDVLQNAAVLVVRNFLRRVRARNH